MALFHPRLLKAVVALGVKRDDGEFAIGGTGFFFSYPLNSTSDPDLMQEYLFLVTNKHVVAKGAPDFVRVTRRIGNLSDFDYMPLRNNSRGWTVHPAGRDVAVLPVPIQWNDQENLEIDWITPSVSLTIEEMKHSGVSEGDGVFLLGFPSSLIETNLDTAVARQGCVSRIQHLLAGRSNNFLIDSMVFTGNSGGPVLIKPEFLTVGDTSHVRDSRFIGMVSAYLPYRDVAISTQTGKPRVIFEENSGISEVVPVDHILQTIEESLSST